MDHLLHEGRLPLRHRPGAQAPHRGRGAGRRERPAGQVAAREDPPCPQGPRSRRLRVPLVGPGLDHPEAHSSASPSHRMNDLTWPYGPVTIVTMGDRRPGTMTEVLRRAIVASGTPYTHLEQATGVKRASIM